jgi:hypothetical protein
LGLISALQQTFGNRPKGWWQSFAVALGETSFTVTERSRRGPDRVASVPWASVAAVRFVDGGQGSDCFHLFNNEHAELAMIPVEAPGGLAFWDELKRRNLFPAEVSGRATQSGASGAELWWPPQHGR